MGIRQPGLEDLVAVRILVTGNMGYVGPPSWSSTCARRGRTRTSPGWTRASSAHCLTGTSELPERRLDCQWFGDVRRPAGRVARGSRRGRAPRRRLQRSDRDDLRGCDLRRQPPRHGRARASGEGSRRPQLRLRLVLQRLRPGRGRAADRGVGDRAADRLREVEAPRRGRPGRVRRTTPSPSPASASPPPAG